jgi:hypothetical protein
MKICETRSRAEPQKTWYCIEDVRDLPADNTPISLCAGSGVRDFTSGRRFWEEPRRELNSYASYCLV